MEEAVPLPVAAVALPVVQEAQPGGEVEAPVQVAGPGKAVEEVERLSAAAVALLVVQEVEAPVWAPRVEALFWEALRRVLTDQARTR